MAQSSLQPKPRPDAHRAPIVIHLETQNYLLRTLEPADITERACAWFADPAKARMINAPAHALTPATFRDYILSHDRITGHALGIFEKPSLRHVGMWSAYIDWERREFQLNVLVGEYLANASGAYYETDRVLQDYMFETLDLETLRCACLARNTRMVTRFEVVGLAPEHVEHMPSASREAFEQINHYRVPKRIWQLLRDTRSTRDQIIALVNAARAGI
jgi:RimJ/RimL family protein N-acetyltransferase